MTFESSFRVYYEDTDMAGIVYYANYLKFLERGRSDAVRALGIDQGRMRDEAGVVFAVAHLDIAFRSPARFDDMLDVRTGIVRASGATLQMHQTIHVAERLIVDAAVRIACMSLEGRVTRLPAPIRACLTAAGQDAAAS